MLYVGSGIDDGTETVNAQTGKSSNSLGGILSAKIPPPMDVREWEAS